MEQGYQLLHKTSVQKAIALAIEERSNKTKINAEYVLQRLVEIDQMDIADIINDDLTVKSITQWPEVWRKTISSVDVVEQTIGSGADAVTAFTKKLKLPDKVRNIELIGKHVDIQAWNEKKEISGALSLTGILDEIDGDTTGLPSEE